jgi:hypothetical protein
VEVANLLKPLLFNKVKSIINNWDPVKLLAIHCPDDEYHSEIRAICRYIEEADSLNEIELGTYIYQTFTDFLGKEFRESPDSCIVIGRKIMESVKND